MEKVVIINKQIRWWMRFILTPVVLLVVWAILTFWYIVQFDQSFLILSYNHSEDNFQTINHERLSKGDKLRGEFVAKEDNLGIVSLRFKSFKRIAYKDEDTLVFRLKEKGQNDWYYENKYKSGLIYDVPFLPFGFPTISHSQGKTYVFELESLYGNEHNGAALSARKPFIQSKYQANKSILMKDREALITFGLKKYFNSFHTIDIWFSSFVFLLPLLIYLFWISPAKTRYVDPKLHKLYLRIHFFGKRLGERYHFLPKIVQFIVLYYLLIFVLIIVLFDIILLQLLNDLLYIVIAILWIFLIRAHKLNCSYSFATGFGFLALAPLFLQFNVSNVAEKAAAWAFIFFVTGLFQIIWQSRKKKIDFLS